MMIFQVAPLAGARIEIEKTIMEYIGIFVAPLAGARIEILRTHPRRDNARSLPSRERGLKLLVADHFNVSLGRSPRGSAD